MFRVTMSQTISSTLWDLNRLGASSAKMQREISSGVRIAQPSDDPRGIETVLSQRAEVRRQETQLASIREARSRLQDANSRLLDVQQLLVKAKTLALEGRQSVDAGEREILANEVDRVLESVLSLANSTHRGAALFGGADRLGIPFQTNGALDSVVYAGSDLAGRLPLADGSFLTVDYAGGAIFGAGSRGGTLVIGSTGVAPGIGTSNAIGVRTLSVRHTSTTYAGASGVQPGASSVNGDTIIGPLGAHQLTIVDASGTGTFGTVSLSGGPEVAFTSGNVDLRVVGANGEVVYLDLSSIAAGYVGTIDIQAEGLLSLDGGLTELPIDFSGNQSVDDSRDGSMAYFDSSGIRRVGADLIEFSGTLDLFSTLARLRDELQNTDGLPNGEVATLIGRRLGDLDRLSEHLLAVVGDQGVTLEQLDRMESRAEERQLTAEQRLAETEGTDYASAALELQRQQAAIQFSLASIVRVFDISILNYL